MYIGHVYTYASPYELKTKPSTLNSKNIKQAIDIQETFILEINLQQYMLCKNMTFSSVAEVLILKLC